LWFKNYFVLFVTLWFKIKYFVVQKLLCALCDFVV
jgi:hypothetical protein